MWISAACFGAIALGRWIEPPDDDTGTAAAFSRFFLVLFAVAGTFLFWNTFQEAPAWIFTNN